jgi:hypothetical protein
MLPSHLPKKRFFTPKKILNIRQIDICNPNIALGTRKTPIQKIIVYKDIKITLCFFFIPMSIAVVTRDYLESIRPFFYEIKEVVPSVERDTGIIWKGISISIIGSSWKVFLQSLLVFIEVNISSILYHIFSFQGRGDVIAFPVLIPEIQIARTNSRALLITPSFLDNLSPRNLSFFAFTSQRIPNTTFLNGFRNAFFLAFPRNLAFLVSIRRYWLQNIQIGIRSTVGYRRGETLLFLRIANGLRPLWWSIGSPLPFIIGCLMTAFFLWELLFYQDVVSRKTNSFAEQMDKLPFLPFSYCQIPIFKIPRGRWLIKSRDLFSVFFLHFFYSWTEKGVLFGSFSNQTMDVRRFSGSFDHFVYGSALNYMRGIFFGGLFFDFCFRMIIFGRTEYLLLRFCCPLSEWKQNVHKWTRRLAIAISLRGIPFYSLDYLIFSPLGFFGRDTELARIITRTAFSGMQISILSESRNVMGRDRYGRPSPDIIREPFYISRIAVEASRDLVDETYRTQQTNQRVDNVYLGSLERKIFEWLNSSKRKSEDRDGKSSILVRTPIRRGIGDFTQVNVPSDSRIYQRPGEIVERLENRFSSWFRAIWRIGSGGEDPRKIPENLFIFIHRDQGAPFLGRTPLEPQRAVRYSGPVEFARKRNARRSPLHRGPILRYIDLFIKTQYQTKKSNYLSTRQQQRNLYYSRLMLRDYVVTLRRYSDIKETTNQNSQSMSRRVRRIIWQRELHSYLFGGSRRRSSGVYSQQYVGNLQLIRRLFAVSWSSQENSVPSRLQVKKKTFLRRKISLDQITFDAEKNIFEHEEVGNKLAILPNIQKDQSSRFISKKYYLLSPQVETKPIYAGWDRQRHALVLCNRFLPLEWRIRTKLANKDDSKMQFKSSIFLKNLESYERKQLRREFTVWPKNFRTRRMRLRNVRYNRRALLQRRILSYRKGSKIDFSFLSQDRSLWRRKAAHKDWINALNPHYGSTSQSFPLSLERGQTHHYVPGDLQPSIRGGLVWPGIDSLLFVPKSYYRPGSDQKFS